ncbi:hypothetical protein HZS_4294 [Henneguya salminicola]|nr:hypothetical protein HZS_4294 [Henneguya salminicola]
MQCLLSYLFQYLLHSFYFYFVCPICVLVELTVAMVGLEIIGITTLHDNVRFFSNNYVDVEYRITNEIITKTLKLNKPPKYKDEELQLPPPPYIEYNDEENTKNFHRPDV